MAKIVVMEDSPTVASATDPKTGAELLSRTQLNSDFISDVAHELSSPITCIKLYHAMLAERPQHLAELLPSLQRETQRLEQTIRTLQRLSQPQQRLSQTRLATVDLARLGSQYVVDRRPLAAVKNISIKLRKSAGLALVKADPYMLGQVLSILLDNAIKYTPNGGQVTVMTPDRLLKARLWFGLAVQDSGPGIPPAEQSSLFMRNFRGASAQQSSQSGSGLGLAIAIEIVSLHNGHIEVSSEGRLGKGARLTMWLPAIEQDAA